MGARPGFLTTPLALLLAGATAACGDAAAEPDAGALYVTSGLTEEVYRLDAATGEIEARTQMDRRPDEVDEAHGVTVGPQAEYWYATLAHGNPTLWKFDLRDDQLLGRLELGMRGAARIGLTPDGTRAFIPDYDRSGQGRTSEVAVVDTRDLRLVDRVRVCAAPHDAQVDPAGERVAIACSLSDEIVVLDAASLRELRRFPAGPEPGAAGSPRYKPLNLVWAPDGDAIYVSLNLADRLVAYRPDGARIGAAEVGAAPMQIAMTPDGASVAVANRGGTVSIIDAGRMHERRRVTIDGAHPHGVDVDAAGETAFVTFEGTTQTKGGVAAIDVSSGQILWTRRVGAYTLGVAWAPDGPDRQVAGSGERR